MFGRYGFRNLTTDDQPNIPLPSGGAGNGHIYARNQQLVLGATWVPTPTSLLEVRFGYSWTQAGKNPPALGTDSALDAVRHPGLPDRLRASPAACRRSSSPATPTSDARRPTRSGSTRRSTTRRSTTRGRRKRALVQERLRVPAHRDRSAGREPALRPRHLQRPVHAGRPARRRTTSTTSPTSCSACARSTRSATCSSPNLRRNMHFAYLQDDWRVDEQADAEPRPALRVRDAVLGEGQHPVELRSGDQHDGPGEATARSRIARSINPDRNNFGPRLGFAYTLTPARSIRGGYGISYVHFHRAGGGNVLPINGPQVINAVVNQTEPDGAVVRAGGAGLSGGPHRSVAVQSADREHHLHAARTTTRARCRAGTSRCSASCGATCCVDVAYVGNRADDLLLFANYNQAVAEQRRRHDPAAGAPPESRRSPTSPTRSTAASRATRRCRPSSSGASSRDADAAELADAVEDEGQRRAVARELERQLPGAAGLPQPGRRLRAVGLSPAVQQHHQLRVGAAVRPRAALGARARRRCWTRSSAAGSSPASTRVYAGEPVTLHLHAGRDVPRSRASRRTSAAPTTTGRT